MYYQKYCGKSIKDMTTKKIKTLVEGLHESIYVVECYGAKDIALLESFKEELYNRGYEICEDSKLSIRKIIQKHGK